MTSRGVHLRARRRPRGARRAFSLAELLLAVLILGIGLISVGSLFPAAIYQQRLSADDSAGPLVAENAMAVLRGKLKPEMFGTFEEIVDYYGANPIPAGLTPSSAVLDGVTSPNSLPVNAWIIQPGDWEWRRPAFLLNDAGTTFIVNAVGGTWVAPRGSIAIFQNSFTPFGPGATRSEIPWRPSYSSYDAAVNPQAAPQQAIKQWRGFPPPIVFAPAERAYPLGTTSAGGDLRPQYRWEVMFRRHQGRILAAIFVFRVTRPGGEGGAYTIAANQAPLDPALPPLPMRVQGSTPGGLAPAGSELASFQSWLPGGPDGDLLTLNDNARVPGTGVGTPFDLTDPRYAWQRTGQWLLDQNNVVHRVVRGRTASTSDFVQLGRPLPLHPSLPSYIRRIPPIAGELPPVLAVWTLPATDGAGGTITPVFVTVKEL